MNTIKKILFNLKFKSIIKHISILLIIILIYEISSYYNEKLNSSETNNIKQNTQGQTYKNDNSDSNSNEILGSKLYIEGNAIEALKYYEIALSEETEKYGENSIKVAKIQETIGTIYLNLNQIDIAQQRFEKALAICNSLLKEEEYIVTLYYDLGQVYRQKKDFVTAINYFSDGLEIDKKLGKGKTRNTAMGYSGLARVYTSMRDYEKALQYYMEELSVYQDNPEIGIADLGICYHDIGYTYFRLNDKEASLKYYQLALPIYAATWGTSHANWANINNKLSSLYYTAGQFEKSLEYLNISIDIYEKKPVLFNFELANVYNSLAHIYFQTSKEDEAILYSKKAYQILDKTNSYNSDSVELLKNTLIKFYNQLGMDINELNHWFITQ